ncbi:MAG: galactose mutarotase [Acidobacteriota bacterium]|nr:galactose mutarotase [Acidobacteriota bacterium]
MKLLIACLMLSVIACAAGAGAVSKQSFGKTAEGEEVYLYTLKNAAGMEVAITNYGGTVVSLKVPDRAGKIEDVVLGYDDFNGYLTPKSPYFGATVGRYANRIAKAKFTLDGKEYHLAANNGPNSLHGGLKGFDKQVWSAKDYSDAKGEHLVLHYLSKDGEEGYPGDLNAQVAFTLTPRSELQIEYSATTDHDTVLNLTNHSYFNLAGQGKGEILKTQLTLMASRFTPVDETLIPIGELRSVAGTPFDFRKPTAIGERIDASGEQLKLGHGYDHNWVLDAPRGKLSLAARAVDPDSGRVLEVLTTQPGIQFYTGNFLDGSINGKGSKPINHRTGFCLETQHFPDSPNHPAFPTVVLKRGQHFHSTTIFRFSTDRTKQAK